MERLHCVTQYFQFFSNQNFVLGGGSHTSPPSSTSKLSKQSGRPWYVRSNSNTVLQYSFSQMSEGTLNDGNTIEDMSGSNLDGMAKGSGLEIKTDFVTSERALYIPKNSYIQTSFQSAGGILLLNQEFSIEVWARPDSANSGYLLYRYGSFGFPEFGPSTNNIKTRFFDINSNPKSFSANIDGLDYTSDVHQYVMTYDRSYFRLYVDGLEVANVSETKQMNNIQNRDLLTGYSEGASANFEGYVYLVRVSNTKIEADDILRSFSGYSHGKINFQLN